MPFPRLKVARSKKIVASITVNLYIDDYQSILQTSVKNPVGPMQRGRVGRVLQRQQELRDELTQDPLLDLETVRAVLGCSYGTLNRLLSSGVLKQFQVGRGRGRVRQSALREFLAQGDGHPA